MAIPAPVRVQLRIETSSMNWSSGAGGAGATETLEVVSLGPPSMGQPSLAQLSPLSTRGARSRLAAPFRAGPDRQRVLTLAGAIDISLYWDSLSGSHTLFD